MLKIQRKGQTVLEYVVLITIVMGALLATGNYVKRSIQGRWKESIDTLGDQYDPRFTNSAMRHTVSTNTQTKITVTPTAGGQYTKRQDFTNSVDQKSGVVHIGAY